MPQDKLIDLAERLERSAVADAEHAINNMFYAERADRKFRIAAALRARFQSTPDILRSEK